MGVVGLCVCKNNNCLFKFFFVLKWWFIISENFLMLFFIYDFDVENIFMGIY